MSLVQCNGGGSDGALDTSPTGGEGGGGTAPPMPTGVEYAVEFRYNRATKEAVIRVNGEEYANAKRCG